MDIKVFPSEIAGEIQAPPSKSAAHRALICAGLCGVPGKESRVAPLDDSQDMRATKSGLEALGVRMEETKRPDGRLDLKVIAGTETSVTAPRLLDIAKGLDVSKGLDPERLDATEGLNATEGINILEGINVSKDLNASEGINVSEIDCGESGSTYRFFLPIMAALGKPARFIGSGKLPERPMGPMFELLESKGIRCERPVGKSLPLNLSGALNGGIYEIRGDLSSQYVTGLLLALPLLRADSEIRITTKLESGPYVEMTLDLLDRSGIRVRRTKQGFFIPGGQIYQGGNHIVEGDYSNAAFHLCAAAIRGKPGTGVTVIGLDPESAQGDKAIVKLLSRFGAEISTVELSEELSQENGAEPDDGGQDFGNRRRGRKIAVTVKPGTGPLKGIEIDAGDIPDLVPVLAATAVYAVGKTVIYNAGRLRIKESDRLAAISAGLLRIGAKVREYEDRLEIMGLGERDGSGAVPRAEGRGTAPMNGSLPGGAAVSAENDHRIAMAMSVAALGCREPVVICGAECVRKSYPNYFEDLKVLGGKTDVIDLG